MAANLENTIQEKIRALPEEKQERVLSLVEELLKETNGEQVSVSARPIWEIAEEISSHIPLDEWEKLPRDGAEQHDHYLYGSPKRDDDLGTAVPEVFADTFYWIALLNPADKSHENAKAITQARPEISIVTTEAVLIEILNYFSAAGERMRQAAATLCDQIFAHANTIVLPHTQDAFNLGFELYKARPDKGYSLTDCISMVEMRKRNICSRVNP